jgi:LysM repeat protein
MSITVRAGDTLSALAARNGVTLTALLRANPQVKNANLIYPGEQLALPGHSGTSSFAPSSSSTYTVRPGDTLGAIAARSRVSVAAIAQASGVRNVNVINVGQVLTIPGRGSSPSPVQHPTPSPVPSSASGARAVGIAQSVLGQNISSLKYNGPLAQYLAKWPGNNVCCANFVSAVLEKAGQISIPEHNDNVSGLSHNLANDPRWRKVSAGNLSPGDVVCFDVPGEGHFAHVEMFVGYQNGRPLFIGSNNVNADGSQRISEGSPGYAIDAAYHFVG